MDEISPFDGSTLQAICRVLGHTDDGLTGPEIQQILAECKIPDVDPLNTKWKRLFNALAAIQNSRKFGNHTIMVLTRAMKPVRYVRRQELFTHQREQINIVLAFTGMVVGEDGQVRKAKPAETLAEASQRANRLRSLLEARQVHQDILAFCKAELLKENYFHAVFEAMKSISAKVRNLSGLTTDGSELVTQAFSFGQKPLPILAINPLNTETDCGEQRGFANLLIGLFGTVRNPLAHNPKVEWPMSEQDALDILTTASLIHRKLDQARKT